jgi:predicted aspartyl protease
LFPAAFLCNTNVNKNQKHFYLNILLRGRHKTKQIAAMVDSGATNTFISQEFMQANKVRTLALRKPIPLYNVDGSHNSAGSITEYVELGVDIEGHQETIQFLVTDLGSEDVIMGITWLRKHNPSVNWKEGSLRLDTC